MKKKILYSAIDFNNKETQGYIEAESNQEALDDLKLQGLRDIMFHDDAIIVTTNESLEGLNKKELSQMAAFDLKSRNKEFSVFDIVMQTIKLSLVFILIGTVILAYGMLQSKIWAIVLGSIMVFSLPLISIFRSKYAKQYNQLLIAYAYGDEARGLSAIEQLKKMKNHPDVQSDIDFRLAFFIAKKNSIDVALELVEKWRDPLGQSSPGFYKSRVASLYLAINDYATYLKLMKQAYEESNQSDLLAIDLALSEAKYGSLQKALDLISNINEQAVIQQGHSYICWIKAIVAQKQNQPEDIQLFEQALSGFKVMKDNPAVWPAIAVCKADLAVSMYRDGEKQKAKEMLKDVWRILGVHGDKNLIQTTKAMLN